MDDKETVEKLSNNLRQAHDHIRWLEQELARLHRLLNNPWSFSDSLKTPKLNSDE